MDSSFPVPPRGRPPRRGFFRTLAREAAAWSDAACGVPQLSLAALPTLPDAALARLIPEVLPGVEILVTPTEVDARLPGSPTPVRLFASTPEEVLTFNQFNGQTTLADAAAHLARELRWSRQRAFAQVRRLFVHLVQLRVCAPVNPGTQEGC